jgi:pimeloyl-CoA synthetase
MMDLRRTYLFNGRKEEDNSVNFAAGGTINCTIYTSLCRDKNKHYMTSYVMIKKAVYHVTLLRMRGLSFVIILVAWNKRIYFLNSPRVGAYKSR